ncbi:MAG: serine hydrolase, partial [Candidatus Eisenbacteria bacterium]|nr:serine hydrolase [Candidatus Eisenbacteria bacterium]
VRERIFEPLGWTASNFSVEESQKAADYALGHKEDDGVIERIPFRVITNMGPAGSINSNVEEMARWVLVQLSGGKYAGKTLIQEATLADIHTPQMVIASPPNPESPETPATSYAMGWFVQPYRGHYRLEHGGNIDGFSALVTFLPQDDVGFVILTNKNGTGLPYLLEKVALDRIFGIEGKDWIAEALTKKTQGEVALEEAKQKADITRVKGTKPSHPLADYVGEYEHPGYGIAKVEMVGKSLAVTFNHITDPLEHWHYDVFNCANDAPDPTFEDTKVQFTMDMRGNIDGLKVAIEPMVADIVFTRKPDARLSDPAFLAKLAGSYDLLDQTLRVEQKGSSLVLVVPGQPPYDLLPDRGTEFRLKGANGFSVSFQMGPGDVVQEVRIYQPNGVFTAKPVKES